MSEEHSFLGLHRILLGNGHYCRRLGYRVKRVGEDIHRAEVSVNGSIVNRFSVRYTEEGEPGSSIVCLVPSRPIVRN